MPHEDVGSAPSIEGTKSVAFCCRMKMISGSHCGLVPAGRVSLAVHLETLDMAAEVTLKATTPLPADKGPYIFVCHPHGHLDQ